MRLELVSGPVVVMLALTLNPKPKTLNPKLVELVSGPVVVMSAFTLNPKPKTLNLKPLTLNPKRGQQSSC